jgi:glycosyltransferase involved in cell wall biosynthesis
MNAADVVVLPYRDIFTSGAALLAMSFGKAIVAPRIGCMAELLRSEGAYLYDKDDPRGLTKAISQATREQQRLPMMGLYNLQQAQALNWTEMARCTAAGYSGLLGRGAVS